MTKLKRFPREFQKVLVSHAMDYSSLAKAMTEKGYRITKQFIGFMGSGAKKVPPEQLRRICKTMKATDEERIVLSRSAAIDYGFEIE